MGTTASTRPVVATDHAANNINSGLISESLQITITQRPISETQAPHSAPAAQPRHIPTNRKDYLKRKLRSKIRAIAAFRTVQLADQQLDRAKSSMENGGRAPANDLDDTLSQDEDSEERLQAAGASGPRPSLHSLDILYHPSNNRQALRDFLWQRKAETEACWDNIKACEADEDDATERFSIHHRKTGHHADGGSRRGSCDDVIQVRRKGGKIPDELRLPPEMKKTREELMAKEAIFQERYGLARCVACNDGTYVPMERPTVNEAAFYCRKHYHALNVMVDNDSVCDLCKEVAAFSVPCRICTRVYHRKCLERSGRYNAEDHCLIDRADTPEGWSCYNCDDLCLLLTAEDTAEMMEDFDIYDIDRDESISLSEFVKFKKRQYRLLDGADMPEEEEQLVRAQFERMDADNNGEVDWWEFMRFEARRFLARKAEADLVRLLTPKELLEARNVYLQLLEGNEPDFTYFLGVFLGAGIETWADFLNDQALYMLWSRANRDHSIVI